MTVRVQSHVEGGRLRHQRRRELLLHLWNSGQLREGLPQGHGQGQERQGSRQGEGKELQAVPGLRVTRSVPLLRQGGAQACRVLDVLEGPSEPDSRVDEQDVEAIEQVECQTCWMVGQVDEVVLSGGGSWQLPILRGGRNLVLRDSDVVQLMAMDARMYVANFARF